MINKIKHIFHKHPYVMRGKNNLYYLIFPNSALDKHIIKFGELKDFIATKCNELVPTDGLIFDVGANVGLLTLPFALTVPKGKVYSFECDFNIASKLQVNVNINQLLNVEVFPLAIQDNSNIDYITIHSRRATDSDGLLNDGLSSLEGIKLHSVDKYKVKATTIDKFVKSKNISRIDLLKIDVEGAEIKILHGAEQSIDSYRPVIVYEFSKTIDELAKNNNSLMSYKYLKNKKYIQYEIHNEKKLRELNEFNLDIKGSNIITFPQEKIKRYKLLINKYKF